ncbi:MAG: flagellar export chaperone FliS [Candidimonas sp.]|nr:MAG: flagellar export chaperone FliS [Candidimonas sp.]
MTTMTSAGSRHAATYTRIGLETRVNGASATALISLLLEGALADLKRASLYFAQGDVARRGAAITHAIRILQDGLIAALDERQGGVARQLRQTYDLAVYWLLNCTTRRDPLMLERARTVLEGVRDAWAQATARQ